MSSTELVALRKESVDRNVQRISPTKNTLVALRKESVDRNCDSDPVTDKAWAVALRKESVDRNTARGIGRQHVIGRSPQGERG